MEDWGYADEVFAILTVDQRNRVLQLQGEVTRLKTLLGDPALDHAWVEARITKQRERCQRFIQAILERHRLELI